MDSSAALCPALFRLACHCEISALTRVLVLGSALQRQLTRFCWDTGCRVSSRYGACRCHPFPWVPPCALCRILHYTHAFAILIHRAAGVHAGHVYPQPSFASVKTLLVSNAPCVCDCAIQGPYPATRCFETINILYTYVCIVPWWLLPAEIIGPCSLFDNVDNIANSPMSKNKGKKQT
jgi:hypothetical protein